MLNYKNVMSASYLLGAILAGYTALYSPDIVDFIIRIIILVLLLTISINIFRGK